jgi:1-acyl-sn-glycerol-3-phosphate acyltransferase
MKSLVQVLLRLLFYKAFGYAISALVLGVRVTGREHLPKAGPAILIANHNSHLDTLVLGALLPLKALRVLTPVAAGRYFLSNRYLAWFAIHVVGILPVGAGSGREAKQSLRRCSEAIENGRVLIFFPEGTRGTPEVPSRLKGGIAAIAELYPDVPMIPIRLFGLGHSLPKGGAIPLPLTCQVRVGAPIRWTGSKQAYMHSVSIGLGSTETEPVAHIEV